MEFVDLNETYKKNEIFYWCNALGEINMPGDGPAPIQHVPEELPPAAKEVYQNYWNAGGNWNYVATFRGVTGIAVCFVLNDAWIRDTLQASDNMLKEYCSEVFGDIWGKMQEEGSAPAAEYTFLFGDHTDPCGSEVLVFIPKKALHSLSRFSRLVEREKIYARLEEMASRRFGEQYRKLLDMCVKCKSRACAYYFQGTCRLPMVLEREPKRKGEDGCIDGVIAWKED